MPKEPLPPPEQVPIPTEVKNAAEMGKLAFFVGNGISRLYGMPSWEELCSRMFRALAANKVIDHNKVELLSRYSLKARISIADHYFTLCREEKENKLTYEAMLNVGLDPSLQTKTTAYSSLAKCGVKFVTTNYDNLLSQALEGAAKTAEPIGSMKLGSETSVKTLVDKTPISTVRVHGNPYEFDRVKGLDTNAVFHLHGSTNDEKTIVASTINYLKLYSDPTVQSFLKWFFETHVVVFLGYGLEELELLDLIIRSGTKTGERKNTFFLLLPLLSHETEILEQLEIYYHQLGIEILPFSRDQKDYASYADLLEIWSGDLSRRARKPARVESLQLLDRLRNEFEGKE
jgi:hypothetical protein